jgi:hypothetical protein
VDFTEHPRILNGASDFLVKVFGVQIGQHARSAVGVISLPLNGTVSLHFFCHILV